MYTNAASGCGLLKCISMVFVTTFLFGISPEDSKVFALQRIEYHQLYRPIFRNLADNCKYFNAFHSRAAPLRSV